MWQRRPPYLRLLIHLSLMIGLGVGFVYSVFYLYLPSITQHGNNVTVPNLIEMPLSELNAFLSARTLAFKVSADSEFVTTQPPLTVIKQYPLAGQRVKKGRSIHVVLNARHPPMIAMPRLVDGSVKSAQMLLRAHKLRLGHIKYVPDLAQNAVLEQRYIGQPIAPGDLIPQGVSIDLVVGDGLGKKSFAIPNLIGLQAQEARIVAIGTGLRVQNIYYATEGYIERLQSDTLADKVEQMAPGLVFKQSLKPHTHAQIGDPISLWVVRPDTRDME